MARPFEGILVVSIEQAARGQSSYFVWLNRGKESVVLDMKNGEDHELRARLIARAHVLVQNLMPGAMARADFDLEELRTRHSRLVICSISGYGETGPYRDMKSYDLLVQAETGLASLTGPAEAPGRTGASVTDVTAELNAYAVILEALIARQQTGAGALARARMDLAHPSVAPRGVFATGDGKEILIAIQNEWEWRSFCDDVLGDPNVAEDPRRARRVLALGEHTAAVRAEFAQ